MLNGVYLLRDLSNIVLASPSDEVLIKAARFLRNLILRRFEGRAALSLSVLPVGRVEPNKGAITLERVPQRRDTQEYDVRIRSYGIRLRASGEQGFRYGALSLAQLIGAGCPAIRAMDIDDRPDFPVRGVMLDISRDKVPTMSTLKQLIDLLAAWKVNQLQLYMEHTFTYTGHEEVWRGSSAMTASQIRAIDRYCRDRGIELVPNQNSLGHMEKWLKHKRYAYLAECDGPWKTPWGEIRQRPSTLNPLNRDSIQLMSALYDQLLPNFSSKQLNVGCDEPWELGQGRSRRACQRRGVGRVYFDYLMKLRRVAARHGRRIFYWSDWIVKYPELIPELPGDTTPLVWGYEADYPFNRECAKLHAHGLKYYVCPGTSSWCSFGGRTHNCQSNLRNAALQGRRHHAEGFLVTDWGDFGHRQYLPVSYGGFLYGAALGWCVKTNVDIDVAAELSRHVFQDAGGIAGQVWLGAGRVHDLSGVVLNNRTVLFDCMQAPLGNVASVEGLAPGRPEQMMKRIEKLKSMVSKARFAGPDRSVVKEELQTTLSVLDHACKRAQINVARRVGESARIGVKRLSTDMERLIERHRGLWLARNRRGGLASSVGYYERILKEYRRMMR